MNVVGSRPRLLCVGHVSLDHMFSVRALPARPQKVAAEAYELRVGGMTANAAVAAARLGAAVRFAGPVGDEGADESVARFRAHFAAEGIDAGGLAPVPGARSSVSTVVVEAGGERLIVNLRGDALRRAPPFDIDQLDGADIVLTDPRCPAWAGAVLAEGRRRGLTVVLDADSSPREELAPLVAMAGWAAFSQPGLAAYCDGTPEDGLAAALCAGAQAAVATFGEFGLIWQRPGQAAQRLNAFRIGAAVDTTAAGDVFHGALGVALAEGRADLDALRFASAAAALKCLQTGGVKGAPRRGEVEALLAA